MAGNGHAFHLSCPAVPAKCQGDGGVKKQSAGTDCKSPAAFPGVDPFCGIIKLMSFLDVDLHAQVDGSIWLVNGW